MKLTINHHFSGEVKIITSDGSDYDFVQQKLNQLLEGQTEIMTTFNETIADFKTALTSEIGQINTGKATDVAQIQSLTEANAQQAALIVELQRQLDAGELTEEQAAAFAELKASVMAIVPDEPTEPTEETSARKTR